MIRGLAQSDVTILLTTQHFEEADQLAARIAVIDKGKKIAEGTSRELKAQVGSGFLHVHLAEGAEIERAARLLEERLAHPARKDADGGQLAVVAGTAHTAATAVAGLIADGIEVADFSMGSPSLDEVFFSLTGREHTEEPVREQRP